MSTSLKPLGLAVALVLAGCNQAAAPADSASAADMADAAAVETMAEAPAAEAAPAPATEDAAVPAPQLQAAMRDLWHGHIVHTRDYALARSEEHTSELQSLMRISYAVFCLKKKTKQSDCNRHTNTLTPMSTDDRL